MSRWGQSALLCAPALLCNCNAHGDYLCEGLNSIMLTLLACRCPPRSKVVNLTLSMESSSDVGWSVGVGWAILLSFNMCRRVVLPALSSPRNSNFPDFCHSPSWLRSEVNISHRNMIDVLWTTLMLILQSFVDCSFETLWLLLIHLCYKLNAYRDKLLDLNFIIFSTLQNG